SPASTLVYGPPAAPLFIGAGNYGDPSGPFRRRFRGDIDEVRIWNFALTQNDILQNMNSLLTGSEAGLVGYWRFDEGNGTTTADRSGHGATGTLTSTNPSQLPVWVPSGAGITTSTEVAPLSSRHLTFSEAIDPATVSTADFALQGPGISGSQP